VTGATDTVGYQEPIATGTGRPAASSTTKGSAITTWGGRQHHGSSTYSTTGAAAAVQLSGSVAPSMTLTAVQTPRPATRPPIRSTQPGTPGRPPAARAGPSSRPNPTALQHPDGRPPTAGISGGIGPRQRVVRSKPIGRRERRGRGRGVPAFRRLSAPHLSRPWSSPHALEPGPRSGATWASLPWSGRAPRLAVLASDRPRETRGWSRATNPSEISTSPTSSPRRCHR